MVAVIDDCDNQHGYPNVVMVQKVMMTADDNDMKCNFGPPCFTQMMSMAVTDWDESNCCQNLFYSIHLSQCYIWFEITNLKLKYLE